MNDCTSRAHELGELEWSGQHTAIPTQVLHRRSQSDSCISSRIDFSEQQLLLISEGPHMLIGTLFRLAVAG